MVHLGYNIPLTTKEQEYGRHRLCVRARIDKKLKEEATAVLADMGLTVSDVVRIVLTKVAKEKALPFEMCVPNKLTAETLAKSERGEDIHHAKDANDLFEQIGI